MEEGDKDYVSRKKVESKREFEDVHPGNDQNTNQFKLWILHRKEGIDK